MPDEKAGLTQRASIETERPDVPATVPQGKSTAHTDGEVAALPRAEVRLLLLDHKKQPVRGAEVCIVLSKYSIGDGEFIHTRQRAGKTDQGGRTPILALADGEELEVFASGIASVSCTRRGNRLVTLVVGNPAIAIADGKAGLFRSGAPESHDMAVGVTEVRVVIPERIDALLEVPLKDLKRR